MDKKNHRFLSEKFSILSGDRYGNRISSMIDIDYYRLISIIGLSINRVWSQLGREGMRTLRRKLSSKPILLGGLMT